MVSGAVETEVKIRISDTQDITSKLVSVGFKVSAERNFEANTVYDTPQLRLGGAQMLLRLREFAGEGILTWKGPGTPGIHKSRPELETKVASLSTLSQIFENLGYGPVFRYEKYRTEFTLFTDSSGTVALDETPIGFFMELEGSGEWIDRWASRLGFSQSDYVLDSYGKLYLSHCQKLGVQPSHMVFTS